MSIVTVNKLVAPHALMRRTSGATYKHWLLACDRWLAAETQGIVMGTFALTVSDWDWPGAYEQDLLPSDAVNQVLRWLNTGVKEGAA